MDRSGALPDRCVVCNADAGGHRMARTLYRSPVAWRLAAAATPFVVAGIGAATETMLLMALFWPLVLVMMIAHTFVRKKLKLEVGMCERHQRWRNVLRALSLAGVAGVLVSLPLWGMNPEVAATLLVVSLGVMVATGVTQSILGLQAIALRKLSAEHVWLAGTGSAFRAALPELPR